MPGLSGFEMGGGDVGGVGGLNKALTVSQDFGTKLCVM